MKPSSSAYHRLYHCSPPSRYHLLDTKKLSNQGKHLSESLSKLVQLTIKAPSRRNLQNRNRVLVNESMEKHNAPATSPKDVIADKWREIQGSMDWEDLLDSLHPLLRQEIVKYDEFAQATYDACDFDSFLEYCGSCRYNWTKLFEKVGLEGSGYVMTRYIYAMSHIEMPRWLEKSYLLDTWSKYSNRMGYVAVSNNVETCRIGRRAIVVAWRGTVSSAKWYKDFQREMESIGAGDARVEHGFLSIYTSTTKSL